MKNLKIQATEMGGWVMGVGLGLLFLKNSSPHFSKKRFWHLINAHRVSTNMHKLMFKQKTPQNVATTFFFENFQKNHVLCYN
jgi:hypothetical protein